jgi:hypothetical protein
MLELFFCWLAGKEGTGYKETPSWLTGSTVIRSGAQPSMINQPSAIIRLPLSVCLSFCLVCLVCLSVYTVGWKAHSGF